VFQRAVCYCNALKIRNLLLTEMGVTGVTRGDVTASVAAGPNSVRGKFNVNVTGG
jgi:hypothetical protein